MSPACFCRTASCAVAAMVGMNACQQLPSKVLLNALRACRPATSGSVSMKIVVLGRREASRSWSCVMTWVFVDFVAEFRTNISALTALSTACLSLIPSTTMRALLRVGFLLLLLLLLLGGGEGGGDDEEEEGWALLEEQFADRRGDDLLGEVLSSLNKQRSLHLGQMEKACGSVIDAWRTNGCVFKCISLVRRLL